MSGGGPAAGQSCFYVPPKAKRSKERKTQRAPPCPLFSLGVLSVSFAVGVGAAFSFSFGKHVGGRNHDRQGRWGGNDTTSSCEKKIRDEKGDKKIPVEKRASDHLPIQIAKTNQSGSS